MSPGAVEDVIGLLDLLSQSFRIKALAGMIHMDRPDYQTEHTLGNRFSRQSGHKPGPVITIEIMITWRIARPLGDAAGIFHCLLIPKPDRDSPARPRAPTDIQSDQGSMAVWGQRVLPGTFYHTAKKLAKKAEF